MPKRVLLEIPRKLLFNGRRDYCLKCLREYCFTGEGIIGFYIAILRPEAFDANHQKILTFRLLYSVYLYLLAVTISKIIKFKFIF